MPGACQNAARAVFCSICLGLGVGGVRKPFVLLHFVGLGVPRACQDVARAVICSICLGLGAGDERKPCVLQHFIGLGVPGACQNVARAVFVVAFVWGSGAGVCENHVFYSVM